MRRFLQVTLIAFAIAMIAFALTRAPDANASVAYRSPYSFEQTFGTGLRLLRVDMGFKILEKDRDLGYIMFEYTSPESGNRVCAGAIELVKNKQSVQVTVQIPAMPQYHEQMIADALSRKLTADYGEPTKKTATPDPDAGAPDAG